MLGHDVSEDRLQEIIAEVDADGKFKLTELCDLLTLNIF